MRVTFWTTLASIALLSTTRPFSLAASMSDARATDRSGASCEPSPCEAIASRRSVMLATVISVRAAARACSSATRFAMFCFALRVAALPRFGDKSAENIVEEIAQKKKLPLARFIYSLGILHVGEETALALARNARSPVTWTVP